MSGRPAAWIAVPVHAHMLLKYVWRGDMLQSLRLWSLFVQHLVEALRWTYAPLTVGYGFYHLNSDLSSATGIVRALEGAVSRVDLRRRETLEESFEIFFRAAKRRGCAAASEASATLRLVYGAGTLSSS